MIFFALLAGGPAIGLWTAFRQKRSPGSTLPAEREFGPNVVAISSVAAANSGFIMIAAVGYGYSVGLSALWMPFSYFLGDVVYWYIFAPRLIRRMKEKNKETLSELIASQTRGRIGAPLRIAALTIFLFVGLSCVSQFLATNKAVTAFFDTPHLLTMAAVILVSLTAVLIGGVSSSILVNVYQGGLMLTVAIVSLAALVTEVVSLSSAGSLSLATAPDGFWDIFGQFKDQSFLLFFIAIFFLGMSFAMTQPHVLARLASGRSDLSIRSVRWRYLLLLQAMWVSMTLFGVLLYLLEPNLADPERGVLIFGEKYLPSFAMGVIVAGIVAGALSTAESQLLVVSNALGLDVLPGLAKAYRRRNRMLYDGAFRILCAVLVLVAAANSEASVLKLIIVAASAVSAAFIAPIICVIFNITVDSRAMTMSIFCGGVIAAIVGLSGTAPTGFEIIFGAGAAGFVMIGLNRLFSKTSNAEPV
ncbi:MAG: hypothetical protein AAGC95_10745 [Pseudomonadota bacterium]